MAIDIESLTIHGPGRIHSTKKKLMKIFWTVLFLVCLCSVVYSTYDTIRLYFNHESYLSVTSEVKKSLALPVITMCNGLRPNAGKDTSVFTDGFDIYKQTHKSFCVMGVDTCENARINLADQSCLMFNPDEDWKQYVPLQKMGFKMDFFLNVSDTSSSSYNVFYPPIVAVKIFLHSKDIDGNYVNEVAKVKPGFLTEIAIKKQEVYRVPAKPGKAGKSGKSQEIHFIPGKVRETLGNLVKSQGKVREF